MRIVELSDYTMTVMKDSEDPFWLSLSKIRNRAEKLHCKITVLKGKLEDYYPEKPEYEQKSDEVICTAGRMMLFFKDKISDAFNTGDKVDIYISV
jgi:hypothetical protein